MFRIGLVVVFSIFLAACGTQESVEDAAIEIDRFHERLDEGQINAIWESAGEQLRDATPKAEFAQLMNAVRGKLGDTETSEQTGWRVNATTGGTFVIVGRETEFERGTGSETFTFVRDGEQLLLVGYNINSKEMMIN